MIVEERIEEALKMATWGTIEGSAHKMWVIDQIVRALTGCPVVEKRGINPDGNRYVFKYTTENEEYREWVEDYRDGEDGPETYDWDIGIAP